MSWGDAVSLGGSAISTYVQSALFLSSGSIVPPKGTKRIEAMLCGGGGAGGYYSGGGFGGLQIYEIPVTGSALDYIVGSGASASFGAIGGTTSVSSNSIMYAAVGGGSAGAVGGTTYKPRNGGCGGGSDSGLSNYPLGTPGSAPFNLRNLLWSLCDVLPRGSGFVQGVAYSSNSTYLLFVQGSPGTEAAMGWGSGGGLYAGQTPVGAGGGGGAGSTAYGGYAGGGAGIGAGGGAIGGSLAGLVTMWGLPGGFAGGTGFATANQGGGGGGGGVLAAGGNATAGVGGTGGAGGAGGGGGYATPGAGGAGFVMFRFYL